MSGEGHPYREPAPSLCAPPRHVPWSVRLQLALGSTLAEQAIQLLVLGSVVVWLFLPHLATVEAILDRQAQDRVPAVVISTLFNRQLSAYYVEFRYRVRGSTYVADSWSSRALSVGDDVTALVPRATPRLARIDGMSRVKPDVPFLIEIVVAAIPTAGLVVLAFALARARRLTRLLRRGTVARGRLVGKRKTPVSGKPERCELRFAFEADDGRTYEAVASTDKPVLEDEPTEQLVYLPEDPAQATLIDHLEGAPRIRPDGTIAPAARGRVAVVLVGPLLVVVVNVVGAALRLG